MTLEKISETTSECGRYIATSYRFSCEYCDEGVVIHWGARSCAHCGMHYNDTIRMLQLEGKHENAGLLNAYMEYIG